MTKIVSVVSWGRGRLDIFALGSGGAGVHKYYDEGGLGWGPGGISGAWEGIGDKAYTRLVGAPAAVKDKLGIFHVFGLGQDGLVYHKFYAGAWGPGDIGACWECIGGMPGGGRLTGSPAVVSDKPDVLHIFGTGEDGRMYHKFFARGWFPGGINGDWECIGGLPAGGRLAGSPAVVSDKPDVLHIFGTGEDGRIYHKFFAGGWFPGGINGDWECIGGMPGGGRLAGTPAVVSDKPDVLHIFGTGVDGRTYHKFFAGGWFPGGINGDWECIGGLPAGGRLAGTPAVVSDKPDVLHIFGTGEDGRIYHKFFAGGWFPGGLNGDWECLGGMPCGRLIGSPAAVAWALGRLDIFALGSDGRIYHKWYGGGWGGGIAGDWERVGDPVIRFYTQLLIITPQQLSPAVLPLKVHKDKTGIPTTVVTLEDVYKNHRGSDEAEKVKRCIAKLHQEQGAQFVLLVGDSDTFPIRYTRTDRGDKDRTFNTAFYPTDLYYACLYKKDGSFDNWDSNNNGYYGELQGETNTGPINIDQVNLVPTVAVGRVPASTLQEATRFIEKIIRYESQTYGVGWAKNALLLSTHNWIADACRRQERIAQNVLKRYACTILSSSGSPCASAGKLTPSAITQAFNIGVGLVSYMGHAAENVLQNPDGDWGIPNVPQLTNTDSLPIMCVAGCSTSAFAALPPYQSYTDANGVTHPGSDQGERFSFDAPPPQPACIQRIYDPDGDLATVLTVRTDAGVVAYLGGVTGVQDTVPVEYLVEGLAMHLTLGEAWQWMIRRYYEVKGLPGTLSSPDWVAVATVHQPWKYMLFGDPSLRIRTLPGAE